MKSVAPRSRREKENGEKENHDLARSKLCGKLTAAAIEEAVKTAITEDRAVVFADSMIAMATTTT